MTLALLIAGIVAVAAGFLSIVYGILIKEFSLGSTLILGGTIGVCSGMLLIGMHAVVQELKTIARRLGSSAASEVRVRPVLPPGITTATIPAPEMAPGEAMQLEPTLSPSPPPPWQDEARERQRVDAPSEAAAPSAEPPRRRNLLFQSTSRKERERAQGKAVDPALPLEPAEPAMPPAPFEPPPASFDDAWPKPERMRPSDAALPRRPPPRMPTTFAEAGVPPEPPPATPEPAPAAEQPPVTVLKSGVVDGMAYSLYSDGSIEAQMPEGMMRFASIDELRTHLDQRP